ncbi:MAG: hypothetical protein IPJ66_09315 [Bacteroidetes bacterium]|nr:hypothetical protein [Bacteroidota bacterium]MBL0140158.1 hypothetical protein [Bacteroidota bacterium]
MIGKWKGSYRYNSKRVKEILGVDKTNFAISIDTFENNHFKGSVEDDLTMKGTPGIGEIEGTISGEKLSFVKRMPIKAVIALNNDTKTYGMHTNPEKKHKPIYYEGTFSHDKKSAEGVWKMKMGFSIFGNFITLLTQNGTWNMLRDE